MVDQESESKVSAKCSSIASSWPSFISLPWLSRFQSYPVGWCRVHAERTQCRSGLSVPSENCSRHQSPDSGFLCQQDLLWYPLAFRLLVCSCEFYSCFSSSLGTWREPCHQHPRGSRQPATGVSSSHNWYELFLIYTHYVLALYTVTCPCSWDFIQDTATPQEINEKTHRKKLCKIIKL